jgi:hypothetical protein
VNSRKSVRQNKLSFPVLSDTNNEVAAAFGLRFALQDYLVELYKGLKNDLPAFNGDESWTLPMPARYVRPQKFGEVELAALDEVLRVNLHSAVYAGQALLHGLTKS